MKLTKETLPIWLKMQYSDYESEYKFVPNRKFRADFYIPSLNVLIEYEGIISAKARHTSITGYSKDCTKYNFASKLGYRLLRYTALNINEIVEDLEEIQESICKTS